MAEERVHFSGERERSKKGFKRSEEFKRVGRSVSWVFTLCFLDTTQSINQHVMFSHIARILHSLAKYPFECDFYNQNMIHLTENYFEEMFKAIIMTLIHTKHDINP